MMREKRPGGIKRVIASVAVSVGVAWLFAFAVVSYLEVEITGKWLGRPNYHNTLPASEFLFIAGGCVIALLMVGLNLVIIRDGEIEQKPGGGKMGIQFKDRDTGEWRQMTREEFNAIPVEKEDGCLSVLIAGVFVAFGMLAAIVPVLMA